MEQSTGKKEDCFDNGFTILTAVGQSHDDIIASHRANDPITSEVVEHLIRDMMLVKEAQRPTAPFLYAKSRRIIDNAKAKTKHAESSAIAATHAGPPGLINTQSLPLKNPPNFPPNHERHGPGELASVHRQYAGPKIGAPERSPFPGDNGRVFGGSSRASRQSRVYSDDYDEAYEQGVSNSAQSPPLQPASGQHVNSSPRDLGRSPSHHRSNQRQEAYTVLPSIKNQEPGQAAYNNDPHRDLSKMPHTAGLNRDSRAVMSVEQGISLKRLGRRFPREDQFMELKARDHVSERQFSK